MTTTPAPAAGWQRRGAVCACGAHLDDTATGCRTCGNAAGPFQPVDVVALVVADPAGGMRLHLTQTTQAGTTSTSRTLTAAQAHALGRPWATPRSALAQSARSDTA